MSTVIAPTMLLFRYTRQYPVIPVSIIAVMGVAAIFGSWIAPHDPLDGVLRERNTPPFWNSDGSFNHVLGTDAVGRDILSRIIAAARVEAVIVSVATVTGIIVGTFLGLVTGYFRGFIDEFVMRVVDIWAAVPFLLFALVIILTFGRGFTVLIVLFFLISWTGAVRLVRAEVLSLRQRDYVAFAKVAGASNARIMYRHLLPGVLNTSIVSATLGLGGIILAEAALSFLGVGVPPPNPSWGGMIAEGREYIRDAWWITAFPGVAIFFVVMAGNFLGDWLRDHLDPNLRQLSPFGG